MENPLRYRGLVLRPMGSAAPIVGFKHSLTEEGHSRLHYLQNLPDGATLGGTGSLRSNLQLTRKLL